MKRQVGIAALLAGGIAVSVTAALAQIPPAPPSVSPSRRDSTPGERRAAELRRTTGTIVGVVRDGATGRPLSQVYLSTQLMGDGTDSLGRFEIVYLDPGPQTVTTSRRDFTPAHKTITVAAGRTDTLNFTLWRAAVACCRLAGTWRGQLLLDSAGALSPKPTARRVSASIRFGDEYPNPSPRFRSTPDDPTRDEFGRFEIDFRPFFGTQVARDVTTSTYGSTGGTFLIEADGSVFAGDSVEIELIPRITHWGVSLAGRIVADSITGQWWQRAYCCGAYGHFVLRRAP